MYTHEYFMLFYSLKKETRAILLVLLSPHGSLWWKLLALMEAFLGDSQSHVLLNGGPLYYSQSEFPPELATGKDIHFWQVYGLFS